MKEKRLNLRTTEEFRERLNRAAKVLDKPASQIIREAIDEKLERLERRHPALRGQSIAI